MNSKMRLMLIVAAAALLSACFTPLKAVGLYGALFFLALYVWATVHYARALDRAEFILGIKFKNAGIPFVCARRAYGGTQMHVRTADLERAKELITCANRCYDVEIKARPGLHRIVGHEVPVEQESKRFKLPAIIGAASR